MANNQTSLEIALSRLLIISSDIGNNKLAKWVENELNGYSVNDPVPSYRVVTNSIIQYSGVNNNFQMQNAPLPLQIMFKEIDQEMFHVNLREGIKTIQGIVEKKAGKRYVIDLTHMAGIVYECLGIQCFSIQQVIPENAFSWVLNTVKTILLKIFIELDKVYGSLDTLDIDTKDIADSQIYSTNTIINNFIHVDNSITIGDKNKIKESIVNTGKKDENKKGR